MNMKSTHACTSCNKTQHALHYLTQGWPLNKMKWKTPAYCYFTLYNTFSNKPLSALFHTSHIHINAIF